MEPERAVPWSLLDNRAVEVREVAVSFCRPAAWVKEDGCPEGGLKGTSGEGAAGTGAAAVSTGLTHGGDLSLTGQPSSPLNPHRLPQASLRCEDWWLRDWGDPEPGLRCVPPPGLLSPAWKYVKHSEMMCSFTDLCSTWF